MSSVCPNRKNPAKIYLQNRKVKVAIGKRSNQRITAVYSAALYPAGLQPPAPGSCSVPGNSEPQQQQPRQTTFYSGGSKPAVNALNLPPKLEAQPHGLLKLNRMRRTLTASPLLELKFIARGSTFQFFNKLPFACTVVTGS